MSLKFKYNGKVYELYSSFNAPVVDNADCIHFYSDKTFYTVPASTTQSSKTRVNDDSSGNRQYIDNSSPTVCFKKNNKTYYCGKNLTTVAFSRVLYLSNGGSGLMAYQLFYPNDGESVTIKENGFTAPDYKEFNTWNTSKDGTETTYKVGTVYKGNTMALYAQWILKYTKITGTINSINYSKSKLSTGTSGYYRADINIIWTPSIIETGKNSGNVELKYSISHNGLSYSLTKSGRWSATNASSSRTSVLMIDAEGGNTDSTVTITFYLYDTNNYVNSASTTIEIPSPWTWTNNSSGGSGSGSGGE